MSNISIDESKLFNVFGEDFDRFDFPANVHRVTAGNGGEALLIIGSEKTALLDCGMAFCGRRMTQNLKNVLKGQDREKLDYIILSHSHYDHIGALPYVKAEFPDAIVCGSRYCSDILQRPGARKVMKELGTEARDLYEPGNTEQIIVDGLHIDRILDDGDVVYLGEEKLTALETKGHTDCSMSFALDPCRLLFTSESTGIIEEPNSIHTPILKNFNDTFVAMRKCMSYNPEYLCLPHFGMLPKDAVEEYWSMFEEACHDKLNFVKDMKSRGLSEEEMLDVYVKTYWVPEQEKYQPLNAYTINSRALIKAILKAL